MTLRLLESTSEKRAAQSQLTESLKTVLKSQGVRTIGFRGGNAAHTVYANGPNQLWFAAAGPQDNRIPRFWNSFGVFKPGASALNITVEANIAIHSNTGQVAGFFARDTDSGEILLLHSGKIAGGRSGIGKTAFLAWANPSLTEVSVGDDRFRSGVILAPLRSPDIADRIWSFVRLVADFKSLAASGALNTAEFRETVRVYERYSKEFSGRKRGVRPRTLDYFTFHGDVVEAVKASRASRLKPEERIVNTNLIDLGVRVGADLVELYEVKTSCDRQSLYTAIGQLVTHSTGSPTELKKFLILPAGGRVPPDLAAALRTLQINVHTFKMKVRGAKAVVTLSL